HDSEPSDSLRIAQPMRVLIAISRHHGRGESQVPIMRDTSIPSGDAEWLFRRLPDEIRLRIPPDLHAALVEAARGRSWGSHAIDIRFSLPLVFMRFYLAVIAGPERRAP